METELKTLRVFVKDGDAAAKVCELQVPVGAVWQDVKDSISDVVLGPEEARWTKVKEVCQEALDPEHGGGTITTTKTLQAPSLALWTHPHENCCPLRGVLPHDVPQGVDIYRALSQDAPPAQELQGDADLAAWWAALPKGKAALRQLAIERLVSMANIPSTLPAVKQLPSETTEEQTQYQDVHLQQHVRELIITQGLQGIWEFCCDRELGSKLPTVCLQALVDALKGDIPAAMEVASKAIWCVSSYAAPRAVLIQLGCVEVLMQAIQKVADWRQQLEATWQLKPTAADCPNPRSAEEVVDASTEKLTDVTEGDAIAQETTKTGEAARLETLNRIVYNSLSALAVFAVDPRARDAALQVSPALETFTYIAKLYFMVPQSPVDTLSHGNIKSQAGTDNTTSAEVEQSQVADNAAAHDHNPDEAASDSTEKVNGSGTAASSQKPVGADNKEALTEGNIGTEGMMLQPSEDISGDGDHTAFGQGGPSPFLNPEGSAEDGADLDAEPALQPEDNPECHQQVASEVLWAMMGRDRAVRNSLVTNGGIPSLISLMQHHNPHTSACAVLCLASLARDSANKCNESTCEGTLPQIPSVLGFERQSSQLSQMPKPGPEHNQDACYVHMCTALSSHPGVQLLASSGQAMALINALLHHAQLLMTRFSDGENELAKELPFLPILEAACTALWLSMSAQLLSEHLQTTSSPQHTQQAAQLSTMNGRNLAGAGRQAPGSNQQTSAGKDSSVVSASCEVVGWDVVSKLARATGQLVSLLQSDQESKLAIQKPRINNTAAAVAAAPVTDDRTSACLSAGLYCLMSSLAALHTSPMLLKRMHQQLLAMHERIGQSREREAEAQAALQHHHAEVAQKRATSKYYFDDEDEEEEARREEVVAQCERDTDLIIEELQNIEDLLQSASEESLAVSQDALRILKPTDTSVAAVQLAAAATIAAMAQAPHPVQRPNLDDPSHVFKAPFRPMLSEQGVLHDLVTLSHSTCAGDETLARHTKLVVATAILHLTAREEPIPANLLDNCLQVFRDGSQPATAQQHFAASLWCLARHSTNRSRMLAEGSWTTLISGWVQTGLNAVRKQHAMVVGIKGFFTAPQPSQTPVLAQLDPLSKLQSDANQAVASSANIVAQAGLYGNTAKRNQQQRLLADVLEGVSPQIGAHVMGSLAVGESACRQVRFSIMATWLLMRQWLVEHMSPMNTLTSAEGLHVLSNTSWWTLKFTVDTPLNLTPTALQALALLVETAAALPDCDGSPAGMLRDLTLRCCWNLAATHPIVAAQLVDFGLAPLLMETAVSPTAGSRLVRTAVSAIMHLTTLTKHLPALGGLLQVARLLCSLVNRAMAGAQTDGRGADVVLLEDATRGLARLGLTLEGRAALKASHAAKHLIAVVRLDNLALEAIIRRRECSNVPTWEKTEELICPIRAVNGLAITLGPEQQWSAQQVAVLAMETYLAQTQGTKACSASNRSANASQTASRAGSLSGVPVSPDVQSKGVCLAQDTQDVLKQGLPDQGHDCCDHNHQPEHQDQSQELETACGQAEVGLLALWGLLNLSSYNPAQVAICRHGLYSLLRSVHKSKDPLRSSTAASILANIHFQPDNATTLYRAELKLKHAALLQVADDEKANGGKKNKNGLSLAGSPVRRSGGLGVSRPATASPARPTTAPPAGLSASPRPPGRLAMAGQQDMPLSPGKAPAAELRASAAAVHIANAGISQSQLILQGGENETSSRIGMGQDNTEASTIIDDDQERYQQARLSFLQWVVDPRAQAFAALEQLAGRKDALSAEDLSRRLTEDPEEELWIQQAVQLETTSTTDRQAQGNFLRGQFSRSLAEGAASLWHARSGTKMASQSGGIANAGSQNTRPCTASTRKSNVVKDNSLRRSWPNNSLQRPATAPAARKANAWHPQPQQENAQDNAAQPVSHGTPTRQGAGTHTKPRCDAWRPHILAYVQEVAGSTKARSYLSQRLLMSAAPPDIVEAMTGLAGKLFGNKVLTEGIKAVEERAAAEAAFKAAVEAAAKEEKERLEAEARVANLASFTSSAAPSFKCPSTLSRAISMAAVRSAQRTVSRAVSRAVSRRVSRALSIDTNDGTVGSANMSATTSLKPRKSRQGAATSKSVRMHGQGVRFGNEPQSKRASTSEETQGQGCSETDAALAAAAAALLRTTGVQIDNASQAEHARQKQVNSPSFVASSLVQPGALTHITASRKSAMIAHAEQNDHRLQNKPSLTRKPSLNSQPSLTKRGSLKAGQLETNCNNTSATTAKQHTVQSYRALARNGSRLGTDMALSKSLDAESGSQEVKVLGEDVHQALSSPHTMYHEAHIGRASPAEVLTSTIKSEAYQELQDMLYPERAKVIRPVQLAEEVPRPICMLKAQAEDMVTIGRLKEAADTTAGFNKEAAVQELTALESKVSAAMPLAVCVATGDGGPDKTYRFNRDSLYDPRHMVMFQHIEGARVCESLYGHYLLPNGKLAHFVLGDTVRKGHQVDLQEPPVVPFTPEDWLPDGLPSCTDFTAWAVPCGTLTIDMLGPLWCPVPSLGPAPTESVIEWEASTSKGRSLQLKTICMAAVVHTIEREEQQVTVVEPTIKKKGKKKPAVAAGGGNNMNGIRPASPALSPKRG